MKFVEISNQFAKGFAIFEKISWERRVKWNAAPKVIGATDEVQSVFNSIGYRIYIGEFGLVVFLVRKGFEFKLYTRGIGHT